MDDDEFAHVIRELVEQQCENSATATHILAVLTNCIMGVYFNCSTRDKESFMHCIEASFDTAQKMYDLRDKGKLNDDVLSDSTKDFSEKAIKDKLILLFIQCSIDIGKICPKHLKFPEILYDSLVNITIKTFLANQNKDKSDLINDLLNKFSEIYDDEEEIANRIGIL